MISGVQIPEISERLMRDPVLRHAMIMAIQNLRK